MKLGSTGVGARLRTAAFFRVFFFDFPGEGPRSWEKAYQAEHEKTPEEKRNAFPHSYVHPFLTRVY